MGFKTFIDLAWTQFCCFYIKEQLTPDMYNNFICMNDCGNFNVYEALGFSSLLIKLKLYTSIQLPH